MKKLRKSKLKRLSSESNQEQQERKHRRKYKCGDEFCKHRKHKKRRKHKKHHHRDTEHSSPNEDDVLASREENSTSPTTSDEMVLTKDTSATSKADKFNPTIKEETMTEEEVASSVTESSGSLYVSYYRRLLKIMGLIVSMSLYFHFIGAWQEEGTPGFNGTK